MDYELAKSLKDAGFPSKYPTVVITAPFEGSTHVTMDEQIRAVTKSLRESVPLPALDELIFACGDCGFEMEQCYDPKRGFTGWRAVSDYGVDDWTHEGHGKTPSEAVARLWLALNKKSHA